MTKVIVDNSVLPQLATTHDAVLPLGVSRISASLRMRQSMRSGQ